MHMRKLLLLLCLIAMASGHLLAQGRTVTGKVTDENGNPVSGVSVLVRGTNQGTTTKPDGSFIITVPANATLSISSVGFATQNIPVGNTSVFDIKLKVSTNPLDEVVVVGFTQVRKKRDEAGAISSVSARQIENLPRSEERRVG